MKLTQRKFNLFIKRFGDLTFYPTALKNKCQGIVFTHGHGVRMCEFQVSMCKLLDCLLFLFYFCIVFIHGVQMGGRAGSGKCLSNVDFYSA